MNRVFRIALEKTIDSGSTIATLSAEYMESLTVGKHTVSALYANGDTADASFEVVPAAEKPSDGSGDENNEEDGEKQFGNDVVNGEDEDADNETNETAAHSDSSTAALVQTGDNATGVLGATAAALVSGVALLASAAGARRRR